jgi:hypothetical protein
MLYKPADFRDCGCALLGKREQSCGQDGRARFVVQPCADDRHTHVQQGVVLVVSDIACLVCMSCLGSVTWRRDIRRRVTDCTSGHRLHLAAGDKPRQALLHTHSSLATLRRIRLLAFMKRCEGFQAPYSYQPTPCQWVSPSIPQYLF